MLELVGDAAILPLANTDAEAQEALPDTLGLINALLDKLVPGVALLADVPDGLIIGVFVAEIDPLMDCPDALGDTVT